MEKMIKVRVKPGQAYGMPRPGRRRYTEGEEFEISSEEYATLKGVLISLDDESKEKARVEAAAKQESDKINDDFQRARKAAQARFAKVQEAQAVIKKSK